MANGPDDVSADRVPPADVEPPLRRAALVYNPIKVDAEQLRSAVTRLSAEAGWDEPLFFETTVEDLGAAPNMGMALVGAGLWLLARDRAGRMLAGVFLALLAMVAVTSGLHEVGGPNLWLGLWQRLSLAVAAVVIVTVAVAVTSAGSTARREAS